MSNYSYVYDVVALDAACRAGNVKVTRAYLAGCTLGKVNLETSSDLTAGEIASMSTIILSLPATLTKID
jgi:hypothetical protein